jgi:hypothetical protein
MPGGSMSFSGTPRFQVVRRLGRGGMGTVYEALDRDRCVPVALKTLTTRDPDSLLRFKREFRAVAAIHHPNLVSLGELFEHEGQWFFTMELVHGIDLLSHLRGEAVAPDRPTLPLPNQAAPDGPARRGASFDQPRLRAAFHQLALGLAALHRHGHLHRDIKPSNVLVTPENRIVILDFGLVRDAHAAPLESSPDVVVGTPEYMAPEQAAGYELSPASDWYAVGALLYEALVGAPPFRGKPVEVMIRKQTHDPPPPSRVAAEVPPDLDTLCLALLRRDCTQRPGEAEVLRRFYVELRKDDRTYLTLPLHESVELFVGRARELEGLSRIFDEVCAGRLRTVFVPGGWGVGKTALLRELARRAADDPRLPVVWSGRCHERESIPFKAVDMLMDDASRFLARLEDRELEELLPADTDLLARTFPVLERVERIARLPLRSFEMLTPANRRKALFAAFRELVRRVSRTRPMLLLVEDLQWADADGQEMLRELLVPPDDAPILFVGTIRTNEPTLLPSALVRGVTGISTLALQPLDGADAHALVEALWPGADPRDVRRVISQAGGHPLFMRELCLSRVASRDALGDALRGRAEAMPHAARALLEVIAIAGDAMPQELAGQAAGLKWAETESSLALLRAAQLARTVGLRRTDLVEIAHDRVREAVIATVLLPARKRIHRALAETLDPWPRMPARALAEHWIEAGEPDQALEKLLEGASRASQALAFGQAISLYRLALPLCDDGQRSFVEDHIRKLEQLQSLREERP